MPDTKVAPESDLQSPKTVMIASEPFEARLAPALAILKDLLARAEEKRVQQAKDDAHDAALAFEAQNAQPVESLQGLYYVTMDGDGIGNKVAQAQFSNDEMRVKEMSRKIDSGQQIFAQWAQQYSGTVIEAGGDEGQVKVPAAAIDHIEEFRQAYLKAVGATVTVGVGKTIKDSIQARELGKLRGKDTVVVFDEGTERELELRLEQKGPEDEAKKIRDSGVVSGYGMKKGQFDQAKKKQADYEDWLKKRPAPEPVSSPGAPSSK
jgi:GGDEF domain-containing protein